MKIPETGCLFNKKHLKNVGPIHQISLPVLSHAACASMSTTTMRDRGDRYGPMEWAQLYIAEWPLLTHKIFLVWYRSDHHLCQRPRFSVDSFGSFIICWSPTAVILVQPYKSMDSRFCRYSAISDNPVSVTRLHWPMFNAVRLWHVLTSFASPSSVIAHDPSSRVRNLQTGKYIRLVQMYCTV